MSKSYIIIFEAGSDVRTVGGSFLATINILNAIPTDSCIVFLCDERVPRSNLSSIPKNVKVMRLPRRPKIFSGFYRGVIFDFFIILRFANYLINRKIIISTSMNDSFSIFSFLKTFRIYHSISKKVGRRSLRVRSFILSGFLSRSKYFAVSSFHKADLVLNSGIKEAHLEVLYNKPFFKPQNGIVSTEEKTKQYEVLAVGHVTEYKRPDVFLRIAEEVTRVNSNITFTWVGAGDLLEKYQGLTRENKRIKFVGHSDSLSTYYTQANILLHTSIVETHGMAVVEAMSFGLPIVCSKVGGLTESVEDGINGFLISSDSVEPYIEALFKIMRDEALERQLGEYSVKIFEEKFSPSVYEEKVNSFFCL